LLVALQRRLNKKNAEPCQIKTDIQWGGSKHTREAVAGAAAQQEGPVY